MPPPIRQTEPLFHQHRAPQAASSPLSVWTPRIPCRDTQSAGEQRQVVSPFLSDNLSINLDDMTEAAPYSRRRSCAACKVAKRRCEPQLPRCPRCAARGIECVYKNQPGWTVTQTRRSTPTASGATARSHATPVLDLDFTSGTPTSSGLAWPENQIKLRAALQRNTPFDVVAALRIAMINAPVILPQTIGLPIEGRPQFSEDETIPPLLSPDPWSIKTLIRQIKSWPARFVATLETPFIHRSTKECGLSPALTEAFDACAKYVAKTDINAPLVLSSVEATKARLLALDSLSMGLAELLSTLQSLLLLHTIQLWDGDAHQRQVAEADRPILESWAFLLHIHLQTQELVETISSWAYWALLESARRTIIMTMLTQGVYESSRFGICSYVPILANLTFSTSDRGWNAKTVRDWAADMSISWGGQIKRWHDYTKGYYTLEGGPEDFGKILLTVCLGRGYKDMLRLEGVEAVDDIDVLRQDLDGCHGPMAVVSS